MNIEKSMYHLGIILTDNPGNEKLKKMLEYYKDIRKIASEEYRFDSIDDMIDKSENPELLVNALRKVSELDFKVLSTEDFKSLRGIKNLAPILYARGNPDLIDTKTIGVVGTRGKRGKLEPSDYTEGKKILQRLLDKNYTVVSGLALGCDSLAHRYALQNNGKTIAVIPTGIEEIYPKTNKEIGEKIAQEHLLVSEFPVGTLDRKVMHGREYGNKIMQNLGKRNLTTASLSKNGIVVIAAADKSGTLHAVNHCKTQKKPVYVLAHNFDKGYKWINEFKDIIKKP